MVEIKQNLANKSNYGSKRTKKIEWIVVHMTANDGDTDENNGKYFHNNVVGASAHYFVDSDSITQSVPDDYVAYAVGKDYRANGGGQFYGVCSNANSLSIELCDDVKNGVVYPSAKTIQNALDLVKVKMKEYGIDESHVIRHWDVNGKKCPSYWVNDSRWTSEFWNKLTEKQTVVESTESEYTQTQFVKDVQKIIGAKVDGIGGDETVSKTVTISKSKNRKHELVKPLQKRLNALGYNCGEADGIAGSMFESATKKFQTANNCISDGEFTAQGKSWKTILGANTIYAVVVTSGDSLNMRDAYGKTIGSIPNGKKIVVDKKCAIAMKIGAKTYTMALVTYNGKQGYVAQNYLKF